MDGLTSPTPTPEASSISAPTLGVPTQDASLPPTAPSAIVPFLTSGSGHVPVTSSAETGGYVFSSGPVTAPTFSPTKEMVDGIEVQGINSDEMDGVLDGADGGEVEENNVDHVVDAEDEGGIEDGSFDPATEGKMQGQIESQDLDREPNHHENQSQPQAETELPVLMLMSDQDTADLEKTEKDRQKHAPEWRRQKMEDMASRMEIPDSDSDVWTLTSSWVNPDMAVGSGAKDVETRGEGADITSNSPFVQNEDGTADSKDGNAGSAADAEDGHDDTPILSPQKVIEVSSADEAQQEESSGVDGQQRSDADINKDNLGEEMGDEITNESSVEAHLQQDAIVEEEHALNVEPLQEDVREGKPLAAELPDEDVAMTDVDLSSVDRSNAIDNQHTSDKAITSEGTTGMPSASTALDTRNSIPDSGDDELPDACPTPEKISKKIPSKDVQMENLDRKSTHSELIGDSGPRSSKQGIIIPIAQSSPESLIDDSRSVASAIEETSDKLLSTAVPPTSQVQAPSLISATKRPSPNPSFKAPSPIKGTRSKAAASKTKAPTAETEPATKSTSPETENDAPTPQDPVASRSRSQSKDIAMAELKAMKIASIQARITKLKEEIAAKKAKRDELQKDLKHPAAETVKQHIKLLHDYNDIKDIGQGLMGMIADQRAVRVADLYEEFGVSLKD